MELAVPKWFFYGTAGINREEEPGRTSFYGYTDASRNRLSDSERGRPLLTAAKAFA